MVGIGAFRVLMRTRLNIEPDSTLKPTEFKEFERRLKFKLRLKYGWFHLNLYSLFQYLSRRSIETGFWWI